MTENINVNPVAEFDNATEAKPIEKQNWFMKIGDKLSNFNIITIIQNWFIKKGIETLIKRYSKDSNIWKFYDNEQKLLTESPYITKEYKDFVDNGVKLLSSLYEYFDHEDDIFRKYMRAMDFKLSSPLTFADDEFNDCSLNDNVYQNNRISSVFCNKDVTETEYEDIHAISWVTKATYDINEKKLIASGFNHGSTGSVYVYDENTKTLDYVWSGQYIRQDKKFYESKTVKVPVIEIIDKTDDKNDFICHIALKSNIPSDFYLTYKYTINNRGKEKLTEDLTQYIIDNNYIDLLYKPVNRPYEISKNEDGFVRFIFVNKDEANKALCLDFDRIPDEMLHKRMDVALKDDEICVDLKTNEYNQLIIDAALRRNYYTETELNLIFKV